MAWQPRRQHEGGVLIIDHRASPGLPEDIARAAGFDPTLAREGKVFEAATLTCAHCKIVLIKRHERVRERAYCPKCDHYICDLCEAARFRPDYDHMPYDKFRDETMNGKQPTLGSPPGLLMGKT